MSNNSPLSKASRYANQGASRDRVRKGLAKAGEGKKEEGGKPAEHGILGMLNTLMGRNKKRAAKGKGPAGKIMPKK